MAEPALLPLSKLPQPFLDKEPKWNLKEVEGRLVEISDPHPIAALSFAFLLLRDAQANGSHTAWIGSLQSTFYPPDAELNGINLRNLPVLRMVDTQHMGRAAETLLRSGAFRLVCWISVAITRYRLHGSRSSTDWHENITPASCFSRKSNSPTSRSDHWYHCMLTPPANVSRMESFYAASMFCETSDGEQDGPGKHALQVSMDTTDYPANGRIPCKNLHCLCLYPDFPLQLSVRELPADFQLPVALVDRSDFHSIVMAVDRSALKRGIYPGLPYANAIALCPELHAVYPHPQRIEYVHQRVIRHLGTFSPKSNL